jgi:hypothetical protein
MSEGASKAQVKAAKADAGKAAKKKPDPEGLALIEQAEAALTAKDLDKALTLFKEAEAKCKASGVDAVAKEKKPKAPPAASENGAAADAPAEVRREAARRARPQLRVARQHGLKDESLDAAPTETRRCSLRVASRAARPRPASHGSTSPSPRRTRRPSRCATAWTRRTTTPSTQATSWRRTLR